MRVYVHCSIDVHILNVTEMMWRNQIYPPIRGDIPSCRIHFGAACIGNHVFVLGGAEPTSLRYRHVEAENTLIYVLHLKTMRWEQPTAVNSAEHLREALIIADADVIRAYRRCDEEKARGLSLGTSVRSYLTLPCLALPCHFCLHQCCTLTLASLLLTPI